MNAIVTVVGQDKVGIIAAVCALLAENNVNILDITQTILQGSFTMVMAVDVSKARTSVGELRGCWRPGREDGDLHPHPAGGDLRRRCTECESTGEQAPPAGPPPPVTSVTGVRVPRTRGSGDFRHVHAAAKMIEIP
jgi:predicted amino acid-binding ACT domain protein